MSDQDVLEELLLQYEAAVAEMDPWAQVAEQERPAFRELLNARQFRQEVSDASSLDALQGIARRRSQGIGRVLARIGTLVPAHRKRIGQLVNRVRSEVEKALADRRAELEEEVLAAARSGAGFDPTLPPARPRRGSLHPMTQVRREVEDIFVSMGYRVLDGPEVELDYYNFQALNIPPDHPSREMQDTFYCDREGHLVMRTQTSPVQIRAMESLAPPLRVIAPGRVFRNEAQDATHEHTFHQVEGLVIGRGVSVGHLTWTLRGFLRRLFHKELDVRLRPGYFPFVEPGFELDIRCPFCEGGCRVCKQTTWVEFCGCGMVHPRVLEAGGVDPEQWTGFAFGFGLDRLVMVRHAVDDIRHFMGGDLRFLEQF